MSNLIHTKQIDPVCGMEVDPAATAATTCYHGKMIFFCAEGCKKVFETNPKVYTQSIYHSTTQGILAALSRSPGESHGR